MMFFGLFKYPNLLCIIYIYALCSLPCVARVYNPSQVLFDFKHSFGINDFNVRGINRGTKNQQILILAFDRHYENQRYRSSDSTELILAHESKMRSAFLSEAFMGNPEHVRKDKDAFTVLEELILPNHYLCEDNESKQLVFKLPYKMNFPKGSKLFFTPSWFTPAGTYKHQPKGLSVDGVSFKKAIQIPIISVLADDMKKLAEIVKNDPNKSPNYNFAQQQFINFLRSGKSQNITLPDQQVDCDCGNGRVFKPRTSLQTDIVRCKRCVGKGYLLRHVKLNLFWRNNLPPGLSQ